MKKLILTLLLSTSFLSTHTVSFANEHNEDVIQLSDLTTDQKQVLAELEIQLYRKYVLGEKIEISNRYDPILRHNVKSMSSYVSINSDILKRHNTIYVPLYAAMEDIPQVVTTLPIFPSEAYVKSMETSGTSKETSGRIIYSNRIGNSTAGIATLGVGLAIAGYVLSREGEENEEDSFTDVPPYDPIDKPDSIGNMEHLSRSNGLERINPENLYTLGASGENVLVAVLDTGIDADHPDLIANVRTDLSYNYIPGESAINDRHGHGTHVAGIIAAMNNDAGMHGIAFNADLLSHNVISPIDKNGRMISIPVSVIATAFERSILSGAKVINNSWAFDMPFERFRGVNSLQALRDTGYLFPDMEKQFDRMVANDVINVFAAGNSYGRNPDILAITPYFKQSLQGHWIVAVALDQNNKIANFSNKCGIAKDFCMAAPGVRINSTATNDRSEDNDFNYTIKSGTSMAAPAIAGSVALLRSHFPELSAPEIVQILFDTATDLGAPGVDDIYGRGMVNLANAVTPQGSLYVYTEDSTKGTKISAKSAQVSFGLNVSDSIINALPNRSVMVADSYDRGFYTDVSTFIVDDAASKTSKPAITGIYSRMRQGNGSGLKVTRNHMKDLSSLDYVHADVHSNQHLGLVNGGFGVSQEFDVGKDSKINIGYFGAKEAKSGYFIEHKADMDSLKVSLAFGEISEKTGVLGGASASSLQDRNSFVNAKTRFFSATTEKRLNSFDSIIGSASLGRTGFSSSGIISGGEIETTSLSIGYQYQNEDSKFAATLSKPLSLQSGRISTNIPVYRQASVNGEKTTGVTRIQQDIDLKRAYEPIEINITYSDTFNSNSNLRYGIGFVSDLDTKKNGEVKFDVSLRF